MNLKVFRIRNSQGAQALRLCLCMMMALLLVIQYGSYALAESTTETSKSDEVHISVDLEGQTEGYSAVLYDNSNGLPTSEANAIAETSEGFIWIGSYAGLIRYDGNTFERIGSTGGISSIKCLYVDSRDRLWMGTNDNGVAVMENGEFKLWGKLDGLKSAHTRAITEDENGTIYIATTCGIATIDKDDNLAMLEDDLIAEANMRYITMGTDGLIYGLTNLGDIMTLKDGRLQSYIPADENTVTGAVGAFYPDMYEPGMVYMQTVNYPFCRARMGDTLTGIVEIDIQPLSSVQIISSIDGKLWICASNGIGYVENDEFHLLENLPMNNNVGGVMMDYLGNLWFTSERVMLFITGALARVYFHNRYIQAAYNAQLTSDGLHQGGLGAGISQDAEWGDRGYAAYDLDIGIEKGDMTGLLSVKIKNSSNEDVTISNIPCFMGLKNFYKYLWTMTEDELLVCQSDGSQAFYVENTIDGSAFDVSGAGTHLLIGKTPAHASASWSYIKKISTEYLSGMPVEDGGSGSTYFADGYYNPNVREAGSVRGSIRLGGADHGGDAGSCMLSGSYAPSHANAYRGAVLCEFAEAFTTKLTVLATA